MKIIIKTFLALTIALLFPIEVVAASAPTFPTCSNHSGELLVRHDSGQHAIVGEEALREGKDEVFLLEDGNVLQCFCPASPAGGHEDGNGIQTNWWKLLAIEQEEINSLRVQGWHFIPTGADWGLSADPYMAKNLEYYCKSNEGNGGDGGSTSGIGGGVSNSVLGLASTGDNAKYIGLIGLGVAFIAGGFLLRRKINA